MSTKRRKNTPRARSIKKVNTKRRITGRHLTSAWLAAVLIGTGAWFVLVQQPNTSEIAGLELNLTRAENRLRDNEERITELNTTIAELSSELATFTATLTRADPYTTHHDQTPTDHLNTIIDILERIGLTIITAEAPGSWDQAAPTFYEATLTIAATGTYERFNNALTMLERGALGTSVREVIVAKIGGDPNDPVLDIRLTLDAIAREGANQQEN